MKMPNQLIFLRYCEKDNNKTIKRHIVVQQKNNLATADRQKGRMLSDYPMAARDAFGSLLKAINSSVALVWRTIKDKSGTTDGQSRRHNLPRLGMLKSKENSVTARDELVKSSEKSENATENHGH